MQLQLRSKRSAGVLAVLALCGAATAAVAPFSPFAQEAIEPTAHHERVLKGAGDFAGHLKVYVPGMPEAMSMECTELVTPVGELWTTSRMEADFMGTPFVGAATLGYDTTKKKYVGTWIDSMTTAIVSMEGDYDSEKDAIVMTYENYDPARGEMVTMRNETVMKANGYDAKFYEITDEGERLAMEMVMRAKGAAAEAGSGR